MGWTLAGGCSVDPRRASHAFIKQEYGDGERRVTV